MRTFAGTRCGGAPGDMNTKFSQFLLRGSGCFVLRIKLKYKHLFGICDDKSKFFLEE